MRSFALFLLGSLPLCSFVLAQQSAPAPGSIATTQQRVDPTNSYHRVLAIVPVTGSGTASDPVRPMFAPAPQAVAQGNQQGDIQKAQQASPSRTGIIAYQQQFSDDGTLCLVEFVAVNRNDFAALFVSTDTRVKVFEVGKHTQAEIQAAFQQVKASFSFNTFHPLPVQ